MERHLTDRERGWEVYLMDTFFWGVTCKSLCPCKGHTQDGNITQERESGSLIMQGKSQREMHDLF